jgi:hypothetical protein
VVVAEPSRLLFGARDDGETLVTESVEHPREDIRGRKTTSARGSGVMAVTSGRPGSPEGAGRWTIPSTRSALPATGARR